jgi:hypothetical protein
MTATPKTNPMQRNPWRRVAVTVSAMLVVLLIAASWRFMQSRGVFTSVESKQPAACHIVPRFGGADDIAVDTAGRTAYLLWDRGVYAYAYATPGAQPVKMPGTPKDFRPHAMSLFRAADGTVYLRIAFYHADHSVALSVFRVNRDKVEELGRLTADVLTDPAALVSLDADRFYLVNRHATHTAIGRWLDDTFLLPRAEILFYDGMKFVTVAKRLNSPSGIALSPDGSHLYVTEEYPRTLVTFTRNDFTGGLDNPVSLPLPAGPLTVKTMPDGNLTIAAQPRWSTAAVYLVHVHDGVPGEVQPLFARSGESGYAAAASEGHLFVATDEYFFDCRL